MRILPRDRVQRREVLRSSLLLLSAILMIWAVAIFLLDKAAAREAVVTDTAAATAWGVVHNDSGSDGGTAYFVHWTDSSGVAQATLVAPRGTSEDVDGIEVQVAYYPSDPQTAVVLDDRVLQPWAGADGGRLFAGLLALLCIPSVLALRSRRRAQEDGPLFGARVRAWSRNAFTTEGNETERYWSLGEGESRSIEVPYRWHRAREPRDAVVIMQPAATSSVSMIVVGKHVVYPATTRPVRLGPAHGRPLPSGLRRVWEGIWAVTVQAFAVLLLGVPAWLFIGIAIEWVASFLNYPVSPDVVFTCLGLAAALAAVLAAAHWNRTLIRRPIPDPGDLPQLEALWATAAAEAASY